MSPVSFEQHWTLQRSSWRKILDVVRTISDQHDLRFWGHSSDQQLDIWVQFPVEEAAQLAVELSDLYTMEQAEDELDPLEDEIDMEAAAAAGAVVRTKHGGMTVADGREAEFMIPAPDRYTCTFDIVWAREAAVVLYSNSADNRAAWPVILAFVDGVLTQLGGSWVDR